MEDTRSDCLLFTQEETMSAVDGRKIARMGSGWNLPRTGCCTSPGPDVAHGVRTGPVKWHKWRRSRRQSGIQSAEHDAGRKSGAAGAIFCGSGHGAWNWTDRLRRHDWPRGDWRVAECRRPARNQSLSADRDGKVPVAYPSPVRTGLYSRIQN